MNMLILVGSGVLLGIVVSHLFELSLKNNKTLRRKYFRNHEVIFVYHVHHSMYGLGSMIIGIILYANNVATLPLFFIALGVGIIIMHTIFDGRFVFIEKENKS